MNVQMPNSPHRSLEEASQGRVHAQRYTEIIQGCHKLHPESEPYWKRLVTYIAPCILGQTSLLQKPRFFNIENEPVSSSAALHFPFTGGESEDHSDAPRVILLEGFPSPYCVSSLGAQLGLKPELFIGHLDLAKHHGDYNFEISDCQNGVVHFRFTTLVKPSTPSPASLASQRTEAETDYVQRQEDLFSEKRYGESRFREIHLHNKSFFSVEQMVSFTVSRRAGDKWDGETL